VLDGEIGIELLFGGLHRGWPTLRGSWLIDEQGPWTEDAPVVARLRETGAVLLGKTTTPEFGWKPVTDSQRYGATGNPWAPHLTSGGSSGGSAAAVGLRMGAWSVGTDGGGSLRVPAAFTGTVTIKPRYGLVPLYLEQVDPGFTDPIEAFGVLWCSGAARTVLSYGPQAPSRVDPGLRRVVEEDARLCAAQHLEATAVRAELGTLMGRFHERFDLLLTPTVPIPGIPHGHGHPTRLSLADRASWTPVPPLCHHGQVASMRATGHACRHRPSLGRERNKEIRGHVYLEQECSS
jgi:Asp-tRNA(Asn)/Glu-tRNA(Gln) amidotransferase A subunit family amidase